MRTSSARDASRRDARLTHSVRVAIPVVLAVMLAGCDLPLGGCDHAERSAIQVEVRDSITGRPAANGALGWVKDGSFIDSLRVIGDYREPDGSFQMQAARERPGTYHVMIEKPGYETWVRYNVRARATGCSVETQRLTALLQPLSINSETPAGSPEWYSSGTFAYAAGLCTFAEPGGRVWRFECGMLLVGLVPGTSAAELVPIFDQISAVLVTDRISQLGWIKVQVPPQTELRALLHLAEADQVRYAALNFIGPVSH